MLASGRTDTYEQYVTGLYCGDAIMDWTAENGIETTPATYDCAARIIVAYPDPNATLGDACKETSP